MVNGDNPIKYRVCSNVCPTDYLHFAGNLYTEDNGRNETIFISHLDMRNETYQENHLSIVNFTDKNLYEIYNMAKAYSTYDNYLVPSFNSNIYIYILNYYVNKVYLRKELISIKRIKRKKKTLLIN